MEQNTIEHPNTTSNTQTSYESLFPNYSIWSGTILDQEFVNDYKRQPQLVFTVGLKGRLIDDRDPESSLIEVRNTKVRSMVRFPVSPNDPGAAQQYEIAFKDLEKLGFKGDDLDTLLPDNKKYQSFKGQRIFLRCKHSEYNGKVTIFWNLWGMQGRDTSPVTKTELTKTGVAKGFKEAIAALKAKNAEANGPDNAPDF